MPTYRVRIKPGLRHGRKGQYQGGDELLVGEDEVRAFGDKFEVIEQAEPEPLPQIEEEEPPEKALEIEAEVANIIAHLEKVFGEEVAEDAEPEDIASLKARMDSGEVPELEEVVGTALSRKMNKAGFGDAITVFYATDGDLRAIHGIGPGTIQRLREVYGKAGE